MKRILILSCFSVMFLMTEVEASSSHLVRKGMVSSNAHIQLKPIDRTTYTVEEHEQLVKGFYKQNIFKPHKATVSEIDLYRIGKVLGFKEYKIEGADGRAGIPTIDLSWPNIRRVYFEKMGDCKSKTMTLDETKEKMLQWCLNKECGLFYLSGLDEECTAGFRKHLWQMLEDCTGYQRIASLMAVSMLNSTEKHAFVPGFTRIRVSMVEAENKVGNCYNFNSREIKIDREVLKKDEYMINDKGITHSAIFHEITHGYHDMIFGSFALHDCKSMYSISNSTDADFIGLFFPMLAKERMELAVDNIVKLMKNSWNISVTKSHIRDDTSKGITNIFQKIVECGLGNLVFPKEDLSPKKDGLKIEDTLTDEMLAKAIYVYCCAINGHESIWTTCEEMLTITGLAPVTDGRRTYLFEDRQNEEIHKVRHRENTGTYAALDDTKKQAALGKEFRYHVKFNAQDVAASVYLELLKISNECGTPLCVNNEDIKTLFAEISEKTGGTRDAETLLKPKKSKFSFGNSDNTAAKPNKEFSKGIFEAIEKNLNELQMAILSRNENRVDFLLQKNKAYLNIPCETGKTPLHLAVLNGDVNTTRVLLKHEANPNVPDEEGNTPLYYAVISENEGAIKALLEHSADIKYGSDNDTLLHFAVRSDKCKAIKALCTKKILEAPSKLGFTPLQLAVICKSRNALLTLLILGANPDVTDTAGNTLLHLAVNRNDYNAMLAIAVKFGWLTGVHQKNHQEMMLKTNKSGETPLHTAAKSGNGSLVNALLLCGADEDALLKTTVTDGYQKGHTPLHLAAANGRADAINALLDRVTDKDALLKATITDGYQRGYTPLHLAAANGQADAIKALLDRVTDKDALLKATVNDGYHKGYASLHLAAANGRADAIKALLGCGADKDALLKDTVTDGYQKGYSPLHLAAANGQADAIKVLLECGADKDTLLKDTVKDVYQKGYTPLHLAAANGRANAINALLECGADKDALLKATVKDGYQKGYSPLHLAASALIEDVDAINALLSFANPNATTTDGYQKGYTPLHLAVEKGKVKVIGALLASDKITADTIKNCAEQIKKIYGENLRNEIKTMCDNRIKELEEKAAQSQPAGNP